MDFCYALEGRYERLRVPNHQEKPSKIRRFWMRKLNGRNLKGVKISRSRKLNWKPFCMLSTKVAKVYDDFVKKMKMDANFPSIVFSCQLGLPVLAHSYNPSFAWF